MEPALWTALVLGFVGSLHCAGMCGPLALALPVVGNTRLAYFLGRLVYNAGRIATYCGLGLAGGLIGQTLALAGFQRWISITVGTAILLSLLFTRVTWGGPAFKAVAWLKSGLGNLLRQRSYSSLFALGALNGLLPCGLVYVACATASVSSHALRGAGYMAAFGVGTLPVMLGMSLAGRRFQGLGRINVQRLIPACLAAVGALLVLRGLALGIPYLSPEMVAGVVKCPHCQ